MSDPQPLTDEEANHYWMVRRPNCCTACRAIARIRADGRRIERLEKALREYVKWHGPAHETECPCDDTCDCQFKWLNDLVNAALEDKTK